MNFVLVSRSLEYAVQFRIPKTSLIAPPHRISLNLSLGKGAMRDYELAIKCLNSLQTNASILEVARKAGNTLNLISIPEMKTFMTKLDLNQLNIIHIAGTKGKGSTSAFCDSILRNHSIGRNQLRTGLFTSPHILEVRERIRINGLPISKGMFAKYFFDVWDRLESSKFDHNEGQRLDKPAYFRYLTLVSFHCFLQERVDAVILEVGVGGEYDSTNVVEAPIVCGISSLGLDHIAILGDTIEKIAWHKAGIIKPDCPIISSPQPDGAIQVIESRFEEIGGSTLTIITEQNITKLKEIKLGLAGDHQYINAALAVELCKQFVTTQKSKNVDIIGHPDSFSNGLANTFWPGRCQTVVSSKYPGVEWLLDGAHTPESLKVCATWFKSAVRNNNNTIVSIIFNCTHGRQGFQLLTPLIESLKTLKFSKIIFTANDAWIDASSHNNGDLTNHTIEVDSTLNLQNELARIFRQLADDSGFDFFDCHVTSSIEQAINLASTSDQVLITGSLYLVGGALTVFETTCK